MAAVFQHRVCADQAQQVLTVVVVLVQVQFYAPRATIAIEATNVLPAQAAVPAVYFHLPCYLLI